jgi:hypothetical protein
MVGLRHRGQGLSEPVLVKSKWGTNRYVYNTNNPVALALIFVTLIVAAGVVYYLWTDSRWSEAELREATHKAASALEKDPPVHNEWLGYEMFISDAIHQTGVGPSTGAVVHPEGHGSDNYTITGTGTDAAFCMHLTEIPSGNETRLTIKVTNGACGAT